MSKNSQSATVNPGRPENENPTDALQSNPASDKRSQDVSNTPAPSTAEATNRGGNNDIVTDKPEVPSLKEQKEQLPMPDQKTDSVWLYFPAPVEVEGITYGAGEVKVAAEQVEKLKKAGASEIKDIRTQHLGAKPMPRDLNGPDYV